MTALNRHPRGLLACFGLIFMGWQAPLHAVEPEQSYLGLALGEARLSGAAELVADWPDSQLVAEPDANFAWRLFTGYQFRRWLAIETAWVQLGKSRVETSHASGAPMQLTTDPRGLELSALATAALGHGVAVHARAGMLAWKGRARAAGTDAVPGVNFPLPEDDGVSALGGLGAQWDFGPRGTLRVDWIKYLDVAGADSDFWSLGLMRRF